MKKGSSAQSRPSWSLSPREAAPQTQVQKNIPKGGVIFKDVYRKRNDNACLKRNTDSGNKMGQQLSIMERPSGTIEQYTRKNLSIMCLPTQGPYRPWACSHPQNNVNYEWLLPFLMHNTTSYIYHSWMCVVCVWCAGVCVCVCVCVEGEHGGVKSPNQLGQRTFPPLLCLVLSHNALCKLCT